ncbi:MAG: hypothetical protein Q9209_000328 [Squamulea sp. 1 TL-2023]
MDEFVHPAQEAPLPPPQHQVIKPRQTEQRQSPKPKKKSQKIYEDIKVVFDCHIPFTSHKKKILKKPKKSSKEPRPDDRRGRLNTPVYVPVPPELRHPVPPMGGYPGPGMAPVPPPPPPPPPRGPAGPTPPITVYSPSNSDSSPSLISPLREHRRPRARSLSTNRQYEKRKEAIWERERREHAQQVALAENEARLRAERDAQRFRDERDRERRRNDEFRTREQRRLEDQRRLRIEDADRERRRRNREEGERRREAIFEAERRAEARRRREEEQRREMDQEEHDRLARQRRARIPRGPRHAAVVHHHHYHHHERDNNDFERRAREDFEDRGNQFLNDAIRAERARQAWCGPTQDLQPRWPVENGLRRRGTIAAGERRFYDDDLRRWGRRWF